MMNSNWPTVAVVGAGFGGLNGVKALKNAPVNVVLVDRNNYHLFQPLLYQVSTAGLSASEIAYPIRSIFHDQPNAYFRMAEVTAIDLENCKLVTSFGSMGYDYLIVAAGGVTNFFGLESVRQNGFDLKSLQDAVDIRNHILSEFEMALLTNDERECRALRTFVIVGGGPTGVECSGALAELIHLVLLKDFPELNIHEAEVILLEATDRLLAGFPERLSQSAVDRLHKKGVSVRCNCAVTDYDGHSVFLKDGSVLDAGTVIWAAGVRASPLVDQPGFPTARQGRVQVQNTLQIPGHPKVFVVGDAAYLEHDGQPLPMVAPVAIQQAKLAAGNIRRLMSGKPLHTFVYKDPGSLATIGRNAAVARIGRLQFSGFFAWIVWLVVHLFWLIGFRNRLVVMIDWARDYFRFDRSVRLITASTRQRLKRMRQ